LKEKALKEKELKEKERPRNYLMVLGV